MDNRTMTNPESAYKAAMPTFGGVPIDDVIFPVDDRGTRLAVGTQNGQWMKFQHMGEGDFLLAGPCNKWEAGRLIEAARSRAIELQYVVGPNGSHIVSGWERR